MFRRREGGLKGVININKEGIKVCKFMYLPVSLLFVCFLSIYCLSTCLYVSLFVCICYLTMCMCICVFVYEFVRVCLCV